MSRNYSNAEALKRQRLITFAWISGVVILIIGLMVYQQTEILYVLSTVSVTVLLIVVALADLHKNEPVANIATEPAGLPQARTRTDSAVRTRRTPRTPEV